MKILIADKLDPEAYSVVTDDDIELVDRTGISAEELLEAVADVDALVVRSRTKVTAAVLDAAKALRVVGRAGTGIDNIDLEAATRRGVIVMNTPGGNSNSAAEHAVAMMMALARNVAPAARELSAGRFERGRFIGVELSGKVLGVVGLGRIGRLVAAKGQGLGMTVVGFDPVITADAASQLNIELLSLEELAARADVVTLHVPLMDSTRHMVDAEFLQRMKPTARVINCARGGIVDEGALFEALSAGTIAGAALDVFETEPPGDSPLLALDSVVATPHLGASTIEAQQTVARAVLEQIADHLKGRGTRGAVNGLAIDPSTHDAVRPFLELARRLGRILGVTHRRFGRLTARYYGSPVSENARALTSCFLAGYLGRFLGEAVNELNACDVGRERGLEIEEVLHDGHKSFQSMISFSIEDPNGDSGVSAESIAGTIFGRNSLRLVRYGGVNLDGIPEGWVLIVRNLDRPGALGRIATSLGAAGTNVANMTLGRDAAGGKAVAVLNLDSAPPAGVLAELRSMQDIVSVDLIDTESDR